MKKVFNPLTGEFDYVGEFVEAAELSDYVKKTVAEETYQKKGDYLTEYQKLKTINGQSIVGEGDIEIVGGGGGISVEELSDYVTKIEAAANLQESKDYTDARIKEINAGIATQTIELQAGWNWVSFNVETSLISLQNALGNKGMSINTSDDGTATANLVSKYNTSTNLWEGNLTSLDLLKMYQIQMSESCIISLTGNKLNKSDVVVTLNPGWNWICYPVDKEMMLSEAFKNLTPSEGDWLKGHNDQTMYYNDYGWYGGIESLQPNKGYEYYNASDEVKTLVYPSDTGGNVDTSKLLTKTEAEETYQKKGEYLTEYQKLKTINGQSIVGEGDIVIEGGSGSSKKSISILFVGNSLTQDGIAYLPYMLKTYYPEIDFGLYMWYIGGYTLGQHYQKFISNGVADIFSVAENSSSWTNFSKSKTMSQVLSTYTFDIVCMQEYFNYKESYDNCNDWNYCRDYITANYQGENALEFISLFHAPLRKDGYDVNEVYTRTEDGNALILKTTISEDLIPNGVAVYRALSSSLNSLGDLGQLSPDGTHTQEGLPCLLQTYVTLCWLFDRLGINKSIYGHPMRMTTSIYNSINVPGANLGTGVIEGTDAQNILAQEIAIKAYKEGKQFLMRNLYPYEWGITYCTFTIIPSIDDAIVTINGLEQLSTSVIKGSTVNWEVTKDGYRPKSGTSVIGKDTTLNIVLMPLVEVSSITAEYNPGQRTIFNEEGFEAIRKSLTVTVNYEDGTSETTEDYTLSGQLLNGSNAITVSYGGKDTIISVDIVEITIPSEYTRYGYLATKGDTKPSSNKAPSNFIYLTAYEDWNKLSLEVILGEKSNVGISTAGPGVFGSRLASGDGNCWYGLYAQADGLRVDLHNVGKHLAYPKDLSKFKLTIDNPLTSPVHAYTNDHETSLDIYWTKEEVIPYAMSLFNNIPNGSTSNMSYNWGIKIGDMCFRDHNGVAVRYYVPAVKNKIIGMYEVLSGTFCTSQTAAASTVGNSSQLWTVGNW